jgi:hypothetical protein
MTLTPTRVHEILDRRGKLADSQQPGTYALRVETPDDAESIARGFRGRVDAMPDDDVIERLTADAVCYVGASGCVYDRLQDHTEGDVRQSLFLSLFSPVELLGVWPSENAFETEYRKALELSDRGFVVWCDGEVI